MRNKTIRQIAAIALDIPIAAAVCFAVCYPIIMSDASRLIPAAIIVLTLFAYFAGFLISPLHATPGMMLLGVRGGGANARRVPCVMIKNIHGSKKYYTIPEQGLIFGRDPEVCGVVFAQEEQAISRCHCCIKYNDQTGLFLLEDLGSSYGTFLTNNTKVTASSYAALSEGEGFYIGKRTNEFTVGFKEGKV